MENSISINFGTPTHGWLPIDFHYGDFKISLDASDVVNDPIEETFEALLGLNKGKIGQIMCWLEPAAYYFYFERLDSTYTLTISETDDLHSKVDRRKIIKVITGDYKQIIAPFKKSLTEFCSKIYEEKHWPYNIDKNKLKQLSADT